jgi:transcriptional regulator with GAF, ATPase, and Fis domain
MPDTRSTETAHETRAERRSAHAARFVPPSPLARTAGPAGSRRQHDGEREPIRTHGMVGRSAQMLDVYQLVERIAPTTSTVLIQGETGTGKELIARAIHSASRRAHRPFVTVDCSALAESLLESELFGHVKGAFTGALADKRGLFEAAGGGTCFLDEIGEISPCVQAKLLRVLQEREVRRVGGTDSFKVDVRVIAATNKDLTALATEGRFRDDLFYRLSVVTIALPPLRERREDVPLLAAHFLGQYRAANELPPCSISPEAMGVLAAYDWPGNVRELQHAVERAAALTQDRTLLPQDLPPKLVAATREGRSAPGSGLSLQEVVRGHLRRVLKEAGWNKKLAAQLLGIHRRTLYRLTKRHGIPLAERGQAK